MSESGTVPPADHVAPRQRQDTSGEGSSQMATVTSQHCQPLQFNSLAPSGATSFPFVDAVAAVAAAAVAAKQLAQGGHTSTPAPAMQSATGSSTSGIPFHAHQQHQHQSQQTHSVSSSGNHLASIAQAALSQAHQGNAASAHLAAFLNAGTVGASNQVRLGMHNHNASVSSVKSVASSASQPQFPFSSAPPSLTGMSNAQPTFPASSQVVAAHAAAAATSGAVTSSLLPSMQSWKLEQLEQHVKLLQQMNQVIPQSVVLLLADARRKEEKKTAKRVANRKSACTSRARKKALVEEMTRTNARLRRQALILSLLPDLVIVISQGGEITFCSAQVERVLQHKVEHLVGANISQILIPESRLALRELIKELIDSEKAGPTMDHEKGTKRQRNAGQRRLKSRGKSGEETRVGIEHGNGSPEASSGDSGGEVSSGAVVVVSDQSFPLSVVKVESKQVASTVAIDENDISDASAVGKQQAISSLTNSTNSGSDDNAAGAGTKARGKATTTGSSGSKSESVSKTPTRLSSSDESSTDTKNLRKANENLERNVRWHNKKLQSMSKSAQSKPDHKDDVTGASVTANNASARLSSLQHVPEYLQEVPETEQLEDKTKLQSSGYENTGDNSSSEDSLLAGVEEKKKVPKSVNNENASDDSGYRESNDSREETSSSASDSLNSNGRQKPLAPTCNVCIIRDNLSTLWCEVTSSVRSRSADNEETEEISSGSGGVQNKTALCSNKSADTGRSNKSSTGTTPESTGDVSAVVQKHTVKELLLCLRPIRDGDEKIDDSLRFVPSKDNTSSFMSDPASSIEHLTVSAASRGVMISNSSKGELSSSSKVEARSNSSTGNGSNGSNTGFTVTQGNHERKRPPKKRVLVTALQEESSVMNIAINNGSGLSNTASDSDDCEHLNRKKKKASHKNCLSKNNAETEKSVVESLILMSNKP